MNVTSQASYQTFNLAQKIQTDPCMSTENISQVDRDAREGTQIKKMKCTGLTCQGVPRALQLYLVIIMEQQFLLFSFFDANVVLISKC